MNVHMLGYGQGVSAPLEAGRMVDPAAIIDAIDSLTAEHEAVSIDLAPPFDVADLIHRCLDDVMFCRVMLHKFAARAADQMATLTRALESGNATELAARAHALKGVAANLSAERLARSAEAVERLARSGDLKAARPLVRRTAEEVSRCIAAVPNLLATLGRQSS